MPCEEAMITEVITVNPEMTVEEAMRVLDKKRVRAVPVVDENNILMGIFSTQQIMSNLLPVSVTMEDGLQRLNFVIGASPGIAKRLKKIMPKKVKDVMSDDVVVVHPDTQIWEAIRLMVKYGSPIPVVDEKTGDLKGLLSEQSAMEEMRRLYKEMEENGEI